MIPKNNMFRDRTGGEVPQDYDEASGTFIVRANGDVSSVDISKTAAIRDRLGGLVQNQIFDVAKGEWVIGSSSGGGSGGAVLVDGTTIILDKGILKVIGVDGLTTSVTDINDWLLGTDENIQTQLNSIKHVLSSAVSGALEYMGAVPTYADLNVYFPNVQNGEVAVVAADETKGGARTLYIYNANISDWQFVGNFEMADSFIKLTDTPNSYVGQKDKLVKVKSNADGLEFIDDVSVKTVNNIAPDAKGNISIDSDDNIMLADSVLHFSYAKGNDYTGDGTREKPLQSIENYLNKIRGKKILNARGIAIIILDMPRAIEFDLTRIDLEMLFISGLFAEPDPQVGKVTVLNGVMPINISSLKMGRLKITDCNPLVRVVSSTISDGNEPALTATNSKVSCEAVNFYYAPTLVMANMSSNVALMTCFTRESDSIKTGLNAQKGSLIVYDNSASALAKKGIIKSQGGRVINGSEFPLTFVTKFSELSDVPNDYTGQTGKYVSVNTNADGLEFSDVDTYTKNEINSHTSLDASKTSKGHMQVGEGLSVSKGVVRLEAKTDEGFDISAPASQYPTGVIELPIRTSDVSKNYPEIIKILNEVAHLSIPVTSYLYRFNVKVTKRSDTTVRQEISVTSNSSSSAGHEVFKLQRDTNYSNGSFYPWRLTVITMSGSVDPNNVLAAMRGSLYFDYSSGKLYRKNTGTSDAPSTGWAVIAG